MSPGWIIHPQGLPGSYHGVLRESEIGILWECGHGHHPCTTAASECAARELRRRAEAQQRLTADQEVLAT